MSFSALTLLHGWATAIVTEMTYYVSGAVADLGEDGDASPTGI